MRPHQRSEAPAEIYPLIFITGKAGTGKTTLLNHVLNNQEGYKVAVIVNDIGGILDIVASLRGTQNLLYDLYDYPEELTDRVTVLGNAALTGAAMLLLCEELRAVCERLAKDTRVVELATNPVFVSEYMERMMF